MTDKMPDEIYAWKNPAKNCDSWSANNQWYTRSNKYISEQKHAEEIEATKTEWYERGKAGYLEAVAAKQAVIDRLMLEYCPDEMSEQQLDDYNSSQVSVDLCGPEIAALKAEHRAEMAGLCDEIGRLKEASDHYEDDWYQGSTFGNNKAVERIVELIKQRISDE